MLAQHINGMKTAKIDTILDLYGQYLSEFKRAERTSIGSDERFQSSVKLAELARKINEAMGNG